MGLVDMINGWYNSRDGLPGAPLLTRQLRFTGALKLEKKEDVESGDYRETTYHVFLDDRFLGTYRIRMRGGYLGEILTPRSTSVERVLFADLDGKGCRNHTHQGDLFEDLYRLLREYEKIGRDIALAKRLARETYIE